MSEELKTRQIGPKTMLERPYSPKNDVLNITIIVKNDVIRAENVASETKNNVGGTRNDRKTMSEVPKLAKNYVRIAYID